MSIESTPDVQVFLTASEFDQANGRVADITVNWPGFLTAANLVGYEIPEDAPTSIVIGNRREVLPFIKIDEAKIFHSSMLGTPNPQGFMLHALGDNNVLAFYIDGLTTKQASLGVVAAMQSDERQSLREGTVEDIALGVGTASLTLIANTLGVPWPATGLIVAAGSGGLVWRRLRHSYVAGVLIAEREAAASHEPIRVTEL